MEQPIADSWRRRVRKRIVRWVVFLGSLWVVIVVLALWFENRLVYHPYRPEDGWTEPPAGLVRDVWLTSSDGTKLHAWYLPHKSPRGAVLLSHGNGGNVSHGFESMRNLQRRLQRSILKYDYPGYGKSEGKPSEAGCYAAGEAGYRWLAEKEKIPAEKIILMGESLGGGVAVDLATRYDHQALVLVSTFTSLPAAAKYHYPFLPCRWLMANRYDNLAKIGGCHRPLFQIHGTGDGIVPFEQGEKLFAAANGPKQFVRLNYTGHNLILDDYILDKLLRFLDE